ncbi:MAG: heparan N-sulfatase, partial [Verrucomicrobiales bacterium]|nr:heparan N-sulfatase [Verrucomicrobiales bacterium]
QFEFFKIDEDPYEAKNLASDPAHRKAFIEYQEKMKTFQKAMQDPWIMKWDYE